MSDVLTWLFGGSFSVLAYTFVGYPLIMIMLAKALPRRLLPVDTPWNLPHVSVVICVHNEESRISLRIENLLAGEYPAEKIEIIVTSDGSNDQTATLVEAYADQRVRLIHLPTKGGKARALNAGVRAASGELIVFADARQKFAPHTIQELVKPFARAEVGAVSGELFIDPATTAAGSGVDTYWRLEKAIRKAESDYDSCIGCTGAVYAIRRNLYEPLPGDTILDDVVIPMQIAVQGYRVLYRPTAPAYDPQPLEPRRERIRKRRTLAGNFQMGWRYPRWLWPWRNRLWWQLISHKYLRLVAPLFLIVLLISNCFLLHSSWGRALMAGQISFYGLALAGLIFPRWRMPLLAIPAGFVFLNFMTILGFVRFVRGADTGGWKVNSQSAAMGACNSGGNPSPGLSTTLSPSDGERAGERGAQPDVNTSAKIDAPHVQGL